MDNVYLAMRVLCLGVLLLLSGPSESAMGGEAMPSWQVEWEKTVQAAKQEGHVTIYASSVYEGVFREFHKKYPEIKVLSVTPPRCGGERRTLIAK